MGKKTHKAYISLYLGQEYIDRLDKIVDDPNNIFDDRSTLLRYIIQTNLSKVEEDMRKEKEADQ